jgi:hypothetical protein
VRLTLHVWTVVLAVDNLAEVGVGQMSCRVSPNMTRLKRLKYSTSSFNLDMFADGKVLRGRNVFVVVEIAANVHWTSSRGSLPIAQTPGLLNAAALSTG